MINSISIENFKGIQERVELELRPITLLFGANSAGKSSVVHALHYAREVLVRRNLNVDRSERGGEAIDLGGFGNLVHGRLLHETVRIELAIDLNEHDLPSYDLPSDWDLSCTIRTAVVSFGVRWSDSRQQPFVAEYNVALNGVPFAGISCDGLPSGGVQLTVRDWKHPVIYQGESDEGTGNFHALDVLVESDAAEGSSGVIQLAGWVDALPSWESGIALRCEAIGQAHEDAGGESYAQAVVSLASQLIAGPGALLAEYLDQLRYIGPLRTTPPRSYSPPKYPDESRWADGLAAWDALSSDPALAERTDDWLVDPDRLDAGCGVGLERRRILSEESELYRLLSDNRVFDSVDDLGERVRSLPVETRLVIQTDSGPMLPQDVGVGVSQLLPVVVAMLASGERLIAVEQPELHVHPRLQAEIGDLLIEAAKRGNAVFVETHSEHLILRLLRRIREATDGELSPEAHALTCEQLSVIYLDDEAGVTKATQLRVTPDGDFLDRWPRGFFEERAEELF